jgi:hypothetical protein
VVRVLHDDRHLGHVVGAGEHGVPRDADDLVADDGDHRVAAYVVEVGQVAQRVRWRRGVEREEPPVHRLGRQPVEQPAQPRRVVGADDAERDPGADGGHATSPRT